MNAFSNSFEQAKQQLNTVECGMKLLLQLFEEADQKLLVSSHIHCLLIPLQAQLSEAIINLENLLKTYK